MVGTSGLLPGLQAAFFKCSSVSAGFAERHFWRFLHGMVGGCAGLGKSGENNGAPGKPVHHDIHLGAMTPVESNGTNWTTRPTGA